MRDKGRYEFTGRTAVNDSRAQRRRDTQAGAAEPLSAESALWLNELPEAVRPMSTCALFPRIVNRLAKLWGKPGECRAYFDELLLDRRGNRQGFSTQIAFELAALKNYFETAVHPSRQTVWDEIIQRGRR